MTRTVVSGVVIVVAAALVAAFHDVIGITQVWPFVLAAAVGLAASATPLGRAAGFALGVIFGFVVAALRAGFMPDTTATSVILVIVAVVLALIVGVVSFGRVPMWTALAGYAAFAGLYGPIYAANPTLFTSEAPVQLVSLLLATAVGFLAALLGDIAAAALGSTRTDDQVVVTDGELV
jgi:hypothetical protein